LRRFHETQVSTKCARAEYGAEFRSDIEQFVSREAVEGCVTRGVIVRPPLSNVSYRAFVDPSGSSSDSMTLAIAHREDNRVVEAIEYLALRLVGTRLNQPNIRTIERMNPIMRWTMGKFALALTFAALFAYPSSVFSQDLEFGPNGVQINPGYHHHHHDEFAGRLQGIARSVPPQRRAGRTGSREL
jgi:hypothetical protein